MARNAKTIDEAIDEVLDRYEDIIEDAMNVAARATRKKVHKYALSCLQAYYDNYPQDGDEMSYQRTFYLHNAILPTSSKARKNSKEVSVSVGVAYDPTVLDGVYDGSKKYGHPDGEWILDNYLKGIHPATNGSADPTKVKYYEIYDSDIGEKSPWDKMSTYLEKEVSSIFHSYLMTYFMKQIVKQAK